MKPTLPDDVLAQLFTQARTHNGWQAEPISDALLMRLYDYVKMAPTSANCSPARFVFIRTDGGKARLLPHLLEGNRHKTEAAPVCVIIAYDSQFYEFLPTLFPHDPSARDWFQDKKIAEETAFRNSSLQGGYLILAARALGLDVGAMSGFDAAGVNQEFFPDGRYKVNFLCNLGIGDTSALFPRAPRLDFDAAALFL